MSKKLTAGSKEPVARKNRINVRETPPLIKRGGAIS